MTRIQTVTGLLGLIGLSLLLGWGIWSHQHVALQQQAFLIRAGVWEAQQKEALASMDATVTELAQSTRENEQAWTATYQFLETLTTFTQDDWFLSEAAYRCYQAHIELTMHQDITMAQRQLHLAQERLAHVTDPNILPLKEKLIQARQTVDALIAVDWEATWLEVGNLIDWIETLPVDSPVQLAAPVRAQEEAHTWQAHVKSAWTDLKGLIRIRHVEDAVAPLVTFQEQAQLRQGLELLLEETRWAMVIS